MKAKETHHTTVNLPMPLANGLKKKASEDPDERYKTVSSLVAKILRDAGIQEITNDEYLRYARERRNKNLFVID
jgi:hypothetical protein